MENKKKKPPVKQQHSPVVFALISLGAFLAGMVILILFIVKAPMLTNLGIGDNVYYVLLIPMAAAAAVMLFGALRSYASYKGKILSGYLVIGGPAVVFLLVLILGFQLLPNKEEPFYYTLRLRDERGAEVLKNEGKLRMLERTEAIKEEGQAFFPNLPAKYKNTEVRVELDAPGWQFVKPGNNDKEKNARLYLLTGNEGTLTVERDDSLSILRVSVTDENLRPVAEAAVLVDNRKAGDTDSYGMLTAHLDKSQQKPEVSVSIQKPGYKIWEGKGYPATGTEVQAVLQKIE